MGFRVRICLVHLFHILHFVSDIYFLVSKIVSSLSGIWKWEMGKGTHPVLLCTSMVQQTWGQFGSQLSGSPKFFSFFLWKIIVTWIWNIKSFDFLQKVQFKIVTLRMRIAVYGPAEIWYDFSTAPCSATSFPGP